MCVGIYDYCFSIYARIVESYTIAITTIKTHARATMRTHAMFFTRSFVKMFIFISAIYAESKRITVMPKPTDKFKWVVRDVRGDGSCFFRALYNAALHTGHLKAMSRAFGFPRVPEVTDEDTFVHYARLALGHMLTKPVVWPLIVDIHKYLREVRKESKETYYAILEAYPSWFQRAFKRVPRKVEDFVEILASKISHKHNWVSEIEVRVVLHVLHRASIPIEILNKVPSTTRHKRTDTMYLLNLGEAHYNYLLRRPVRKKNTFTMC